MSLLWDGFWLPFFSNVESMKEETLLLRKEEEKDAEEEEEAFEEHAIIIIRSIQIHTFSLICDTKKGEEHSWERKRPNVVVSFWSQSTRNRSSSLTIHRVQALVVHIPGFG